MMNPNAPLPPLDHKTAQNLIHEACDYAERQLNSVSEDNTLHLNRLRISRAIGVLTLVKPYNITNVRCDALRQRCNELWKVGTRSTFAYNPNNWDEWDEWEFREFNDPHDW